MESRCNDPMNFVAPEICVSCVGVLGAEGPEVVEFALSSAGSFPTEYRTVVANIINVPFESAGSGLNESVDEWV